MLLLLTLTVQSYCVALPFQNPPWEIFFASITGVSQCLDWPIQLQYEEQAKLIFVETSYRGLQKV